MKIANFIVALSVLAIMAAAFIFFPTTSGSRSGLIAIANYGPHSSLIDSISGLKKAMAENGFVDGKSIKYLVADVGFDSHLVPQMVSKLVSNKPDVLVVLTTPVAQYAKAKVHNIPIIYMSITDPVGAGLITSEGAANGNVTGSSDRQDIDGILIFAKKLLPEARAVGILYSTAESNDLSLLDSMQAATKHLGLGLVAVPVEQARDVAVRMVKFKDKVDFIYVGSSGPIQPSLPVIAATASKMGVPIFNLNEQAVREGSVLASFGVNYIKVGENAGNMVAKILNGTKVADIKPYFPTPEDHIAFINLPMAKKYGVMIPSNIDNLTVID